MAEKLTLETFGVDLEQLGRRITRRQAELVRDDTACAAMAGVSIERWQSWQHGREWPGLGRVPKLAAALDTSPEFVMFGPSAIAAVETANDSTATVRRIMDVMARLVPAIQTIDELTAEIDRHRFRISGGDAIASSLTHASTVFRRANADASSP